MTASFVATRQNLQFRRDVDSASDAEATGFGNADVVAYI